MWLILKMEIYCVKEKRKTKCVSGSEEIVKAKWLKNLNLMFILLYLRYMWGRGLVENVIWGEEGYWLKTS